jgi:hypothetical protein
MLSQGSLAPAAAEDFSSWPYCSHVTLNTSSSGANVGADVTNFPVMIRLNASNFDGIKNKTALPEQIRFSKADGTTPLAFQVDSWRNSGSGDDSAAIWVRLDTVKGNNAAQSIVMYWGKPGNDSAMAAVFDTALGFAGAWHLEDETLQDATVNQNHGFDMFTTAESGVIGNCRSFDASTQSQMVVISNAPTLCPAGQLTYSTWFKTSQLALIGYKISVIRMDQHFNALELTGGPDQSKSLARSSFWRSAERNPVAYSGKVGLMTGTTYVTADLDDILLASAGHRLLNEEFKKVNNNDGTVSFISYKTQRYVGIDQPNNNRLVARYLAGDAAMFTMVSQSDTSFKLQANNGQYVAIPVNEQGVYANGAANDAATFYYDYAIVPDSVVVWDNPAYRTAAFGGVAGIVSNFSGTYLSVMGDQEMWMATAVNYNLNESYTKVNNGDGTVSFRSEKTMKYISLMPGNSNRFNALATSIGTTEKFTMDILDDGSFTLQASNGKYVSATGDGRLMQADVDAPGELERFHFFFASDPQGTGSEWDVADGEWHHFAATYSSTEGYKAYLDGVLQASRPDLTGKLQTSASSLFFGCTGEQNMEFYSGLLDEVELHKVARPADWIKLSYENQKADQKLVALGAMVTGLAPQATAAPATAFSLDCNRRLAKGSLIRFSAPAGQKVTLALFSTRGQLVRTLVKDANASGSSAELLWDGLDDTGRELSNGSFVLRLTSGSQTRSRLLFALR